MTLFTSVLAKHPGMAWDDLMAADASILGNAGIREAAG